MNTDLVGQKGITLDTKEHGLNILLDLNICSLFSRRRQWHPTPVLLPGKSHGRRSIVDYSPWGRKESDTTERLNWTEQTFLMALMVKHLLTVQEIQVWSLGQEDPLEKEMATHSSTYAWKIPWMEEHGRLQSMGSQRVRHDWAISLSRKLIVPWSDTKPLCLIN